MHSFLKELIQLDKDSINNSTIIKCLDQVDLQGALPYLNINDTPSDEYKRQLIIQDYVSAYLMCWPPGVVSSIHEHKNFWGVIKLLKGKLIEREYHFDHHQLDQKKEQVFYPNDVLFEETSAIHEVCNPSKDEIAVTLHVYYPAHKNLSGCRLFDIQSGSIAVLSEQSTSFSWNQPKEAFQSIKANQFNLR